MFIDHSKIYVKAGDGGNGALSFHTEKYITNGGPDGGDGGDGGDVILQAAQNLTSLQNFRFKHKFIGNNGAKGMGKKMYGKRGEDLIIGVPVGTVVKDVTTGEIIADLTEPGQKIVVAKGGKGGLGNMHYANSVRQAPQFATPGTAGEERELSIELKLIADCGLVGFPNAGKSTLLSVLTRAKPKIADYPFTTLEPVLGVVTKDDFSYVIADIPGIIENAHEGAGLGHDFLRHIERTRLLVHVVDLAGTDGRDPIEDFKTINNELEEFSLELASRPQIVVGNKCDGVTDEDINGREDLRQLPMKARNMTSSSMRTAILKLPANGSPRYLTQPTSEIPNQRTSSREHLRMKAFSRNSRRWVLKREIQSKFAILSSIIMTKLPYFKVFVY